MKTSGQQRSRAIAQTLAILFVIAVVARSMTEAIAAIPAGGGFELTRSTIDGGGVMFSTGGTFELSGTIGQPDAGVLTGGAFELTGGFWFQTPPGDCESDGDIGLFDYDGFEPCLAGPDVAPMTTECECYDVNRSGAVDLIDFSVLQTGFTGD